MSEVAQMMKKNSALYYDERAAQRVNDIAALAKIKALERELYPRCVIVRLKDLTLAGLPHTLEMMLDEWGYSTEQINDIMSNAKNCVGRKKRSYHRLRDQERSAR